MIPSIKHSNCDKNTASAMGYKQTLTPKYKMPAIGTLLSLLFADRMAIKGSMQPFVGSVGLLPVKKLFNGSYADKAAVGLL